jgi:enolase-phosphatase E1
VEGAVAILPADHKDEEALRESIVKNIQWQMSIDRKIGPLKSFQGYMWRFAYEKGDVKGT